MFTAVDFLYTGGCAIGLATGGGHHFRSQKQRREKEGTAYAYGIAKNSELGNSEETAMKNLRQAVTAATKLANALLMRLAR